MAQTIDKRVVIKQPPAQNPQKTKHQAKKQRKAGSKAFFRRLFGTQKQMGLETEALL